MGARDCLDVLLADDAAAGARRAHADEAAAAPRAVTRGETFHHHGDAQQAKVDWLNATFKTPDTHSVGQFLSLLSRAVGRPVDGIEGRGIFGFTHSIKLFAAVGSRKFPLGCVAYGGEHQQGRSMLQITGAGCQMVRSWSRVRKLLKALDARLTRLDLAVDFLEGQYSVDDAVTMHRAGEFKCHAGGRNPSTTVAGDWLENIKGRTLYVGSAVNGKLLRVYEKGRQLGDLDSPWVRFEVQLGNRDRVIPLEAITDRDSHLAGCYPALEKMLGCASDYIKTTQSGGSVTLGHLMFHMKRSYGKLVDVLRTELKAGAESLIDEVRVVGAPRRLAPSTLASGLTWAQLLARFKA